MASAVMLINMDRGSVSAVAEQQAEPDDHTIAYSVGGAREIVLMPCANDKENVAEFIPRRFANFDGGVRRDLMTKNWPDRTPHSMRRGHTVLHHD